VKTEIYDLLGLARRAGKIAAGDTAVEACLKKRKGALLIIAGDAPGSLKKYQQWAADLGIAVLNTGEKRTLGEALGLSPRAVVLVMDEGFSRLILKRGVEAGHTMGC
jgi:ribosomal protein L7Ae-like RNA K-turn-binding protein